MTMKPAAHWDEVFREEFEKESERACVILATAMLDQALETILRAGLVPISSPKDELLEVSYAPIGTFSARIDLAHRIGLISTKFCRDLHIIRAIRNDFAHDIRGCTFDNDSVRNRVLALVRSSGVVERCPKIRQTFMGGARGDFQMTVSWMLYHLWSLASRVQSIELAPLEWGYFAKDAD